MKKISFLNSAALPELIAQWLLGVLNSRLHGLSCQFFWVVFRQPLSFAHKDDEFSLPLKTVGEAMCENRDCGGGIGHFRIGETGIGDLFLPQDARQFVVTQAKMYSKLSLRVTNASYFNQAARNVACMAKVISKRLINTECVEAKLKDVFKILVGGIG